jgi:hypothetical protein
MGIERNGHSGQAKDPQINSTPGDFVICQDCAGVACCDATRNQERRDGLGAVSEIFEGNGLKAVMTLDFNGQMIRKATCRSRKPLIKVLDPLFGCRL